MALTKTHKSFRSVKLMPIDANNIIIEQAFARFLVLIRTKGLPITSTTKATLHPEDLVDEYICKDTVQFHGVNDPPRKRLVEHWLASDFTTCVKEGEGHAGKPRIANLKPIHMSTIKLLDPRIRSQDRDLSQFFFNLFRDSDLIIGSESLLVPYLTEGTEAFGDYDSRLKTDQAKNLDIETLFLLRLLEHFKVDKPDKKKKVPPHDFLCQAQRQLIINDTALLLVYKDSMPRRELIQYLITLLSFHSALYALKTFSIINSAAEDRKVRCSRCKGITMANLDNLGQCEHHPDIFLDVTSGQDKTCEELAKRNVARHYAIMYRYIRSHFKLKKLDEFVSTFGQQASIDDLIKFMDHKDLEGYFRVKLGEVSSLDDDEEQDPEIKAILDLKLPPLETYVEILYQKTFKALSKRHKQLMGSLCGLNREDGFLHGGKGKKRKYVLGNHLLEVLVQLAVVDAKHGHKFYTKPITITRFVSWLNKRYGIMIDTTKESDDSPDVARALETNYTALKDRLRQLGFFTDLSDASNSQVIRPRFTIKNEP